MTRPDHPRTSGISDKLDICPDDLRAVCIIGVCRGWSGRVVTAQCVFEASFSPTKRQVARRSRFVLVLVFAATHIEMALWSALLIRIEKQDVEILDIYVEIEKSKNELFLRS